MKNLNIQHVKFFSNFAKNQLLALLLVGLSTVVAGQTTYTFTTAGSWATGSNWAGGVIPPIPLPAGDSVVINAACTMGFENTNNGAITVSAGNSLAIDQSNLDNDFSLYNNGTIHNYGTISVHIFRLTNNSGGTITTYNGGLIRFEFLGVMHNFGNWTSNSGASIISLQAGVINNENGGVANNNGAVTMGWGWYNNTGSILNNNGTFGGTASSGWIVNNGTVNLNNGSTLTALCSFTNTGTLNNNAGSTLILSKSPVVWPAGTFNWNSGSTITVGAPLTIASGQTITVPMACTFSRINGNGIIISSGGFLVNNGTFTPSFGPFTVSSGGTLTNNASGTVTLVGVILANSGTTTNHGTFNINQTSGQVTNNSSGVFTNNGTINANSTFINSGTFTNNATFNLNSGGILELNTNPVVLPGGTFNWNNNGHLRIGTNGNLNLTSTLNVMSGRIFSVQSTLPFTISAGGQLVNEGDTRLYFSSSVNNGTITNGSGGTITLHSGSLNNNGTLNNSGFFVLRNTFTNTGVFNQNAGSSGVYYCYSISSLIPGGTFNWNGGGLNIGFFNIYTGSATLGSPFTLPAGRSLNVNQSSVLTNNSTMTIAATGSFGLWGTLTNNSTLVNNGVISPFGGSTFTNNGTIKGTGSQQGSQLFTNGTSGVVSPGASPGCYDFFQGFTNLGTLEMQINGPTTCTEFDKVSVIGTMTKGGILNLTFGFSPMVGQTFQIITATSVVGNFSTINVTPSDIVVSESAGIVTVTAVAGPGAIVLQPSLNPVYCNNDSLSIGWSASGGIAQVNIHLSMDGGNTFPVPIALNVPNGQSPVKYGLTGLAGNAFVVKISDIPNTISVLSGIFMVHPIDTTYINSITCNVNEAGVTYQNLMNQYGCDSTVVTTVQLDPIPPMLSCGSANVSLGLDGMVTLQPDDLIQFVFDNCGGMPTTSLSTGTFNCYFLGQNYVTVYAEDAAGNVGSCIASVTIADNFGYCGCDGTDTLFIAAPIEQSVYHYSNTINAAGSVADGTTVIFKAGLSITLNPGFEVELGGTLAAEIEECSPQQPLIATPPNKMETPAISPAKSRQLQAEPSLPVRN